MRKLKKRESAFLRQVAAGTTPEGHGLTRAALHRLGAIQADETDDRILGRVVLTMAGWAALGVS